MPNFKPDDPYILTDLLNSQKLITDSYNRFGNICTSESITSDVIAILIEEHQIKSELVAEMTKRKLLNARSANENILNTVKSTLGKGLQ